MYAIQNENNKWYQGTTKNSWGHIKTRAIYSDVYALPAEIPETTSVRIRGRGAFTNTEIIPHLTLMVRGEGAVIHYEDIGNPGAPLAWVRPLRDA